MVNKKIFVFFLIILVSPLIAGAFGIIFNQITYFLSSEYFTRNMFYKFGLVENYKESPRLGVFVVGFLSSWWVGLPMGILLGLVGCFFKNGKAMLKETLKAISISVFITFLILFIKTTYDIIKYWSSFETFYFILPNDITRYGLRPFLVMLISEFSYLGGLLGGLLGLIAGITFLIWKLKKPTTNKA